MPYEWPVAQIQEHIINALASSGADATGFRLRVPNEEDHTPAMSRVVKDLIFSCSDFPYLDAEKPLRKYKELITTAPFILMAESSAPKERAVTVFAAPPPLVAPPMPPAVEEVLVVTPPEETFSAPPPPSIKTFSPPPPPSFSTPPPPMLSATEDRAPLRAPPPLAPPPSLSEPSEPPSVLLAPPSLVTAAASLSVQVAFPMDSHLPMQSFRVPADATIQEAMDQIRRETGGVLSEHSSLCVDPMARHVGTFANAPSFPYFDNSVSLTFYREAVTRNVLYWRNTKESGSASTAKGGAPGQDSSASVDAHPNEYLLKGNQRDSFFFFNFYIILFYFIIFCFVSSVSFHPDAPIAKKQFWIPYSSTVEEATEKVAEFLSERGLDTAGFKLAFPPEMVSTGVVASSFVDPKTTFQQLRPALVQTESMQFRHPDHPSWPEKKARPQTADEPRFATFLKGEIERTPVGKSDEKKRGGILDRMGSVLRPEKETAPVGVYDGLIVDTSSMPLPKEDDTVDSAPKLVSDGRRAGSAWKSLLSFKDVAPGGTPPATTPAAVEDEDSKSDEKIVASYGDDRRKRGDVVVADAVSEAPEQEYRSQDDAAAAVAPPPPPPVSNVHVSAKPTTAGVDQDKGRSRNPKLARLASFVETGSSDQSASVNDQPTQQQKSGGAGGSRNPKLDRLMADVAAEEVAVGEVGEELLSSEVGHEVTSTPDRSRSSSLRGFFRKEDSGTTASTPPPPPAAHVGSGFSEEDWDA